MPVRTPCYGVEVYVRNPVVERRYTIPGLAVLCQVHTWYLVYIIARNGVRSGTR